MRVTCRHCGGPHPAFECRKKESTAARKDVPTSKASYQATLQVAKASSDEEGLDAGAGTQALPVDTMRVPASRQELNARSKADALSNAESPNGRAMDFDSIGVGSTPTSASKFDKKSWQREYMREHRRGIRRRKPVAND